MTAICGGGTSAPRPLTEASVLVGSGYIAQLLSKSGNGWLQFAAALLTLPQFVLSLFCASDPPAMPSFTSAESDALLNLKFGADLETALPKFSALVANLVWQDQCECTSGALVVPPPVAAPSGTPIYLPPPAPSGTPCYHLDTLPPQTVNLGTESDIQIAPLYTTSLYFPPLGQYPTSYVAHLSSTLSFGTGTDWTLDYRWSNGGPALIDIQGPVLYVDNQSATVQEGPLSLPNLKYLQFMLRGRAGAGNGTTAIVASIDVYCNGQGPGAQQACCPPDTATQSTLDLILRMVTLQQRRRVPFAYIRGAAHSGLTGIGSVAIPDLLGVDLDVTARPPAGAALFGNPPYIMDLGWIAIGDSDGMLDERRLTRDHQLWIPELITLAKTFSYALAPGVTLTMTELEAEA